MRNLLLITLLLIHLQCTLVANLVNDKKEPKIESAKSLERWAARKGFKGVEMATVAPENYDFFHRFYNHQFIFSADQRFLAVGFHQGVRCVIPHRAIKTLKPVGALKEIPDSFIISQFYQPVFIPGSDTMSKKEIIRQARQKFNSGEFPVISDTTYPDLNFIIENMRDLSGNPFSFREGPEYDYLLILPFAKFLGNTLFLQDLRKRYDAAVNNEHARFRILLLNIDKQEWWPDPEEKENIL